MKPILCFALCVLMAGCNPPSQEWSTAPTDYVCTADQMKVVEDQAEWCNENTSYLSTYCYGSAFVRNCKKVTK